jgi:hypothetical protein
MPDFRQQIVRAMARREWYAYVGLEVKSLLSVSDLETEHRIKACKTELFYLHRFSPFSHNSGQPDHRQNENSRKCKVQRSWALFDKLYSRKG